MAPAGNTRYASKAVYGSSAYDYENQPFYGNAVPEQYPEQYPGERPGARPVERPAKVKKKQQTYGISIFAIMGFVLAAVMIVFVLLAYVRYNDVSYKTLELQEQLAQLNEDGKKLQIAYEDAFDVNEIERYATDILGMHKPVEAQIGKVNTTAPDKAVVVGSGDKEEGFISGFFSFIGSLMEYLKYE